MIHELFLVVVFVFAGLGFVHVVIAPIVTYFRRHANPSPPRDYDLGTDDLPEPRYPPPDIDP
jgi:hypothetical protein